MGAQTATAGSADRMRSLPLPYPDPALYKAVMEEGFQTFPGRRENYRRYQANERGERLDHLPIKLDIENVSRCNFRCSMCQVSKWPKQKRADDMSLDDFKHLIDGLTDSLIEVKIQGMGEPLLNADTYIEMIRYARGKHIWVRSTVNGSLLHLNDNFKRLIDSDICEIHVSVDGATAETFEKIRAGSRFSMVTHNAAMLNAYARDQGRMRTRMWTVGQLDNFHEFELLPDLAAELGFARLSVSLDLNDWGQENWKSRNDQFDIQSRFTRELADRMIERGSEKGVEVTFWFLDRKFDAADPKTLCPWPFERAYISSDMRVVPCCMIANPEALELGDAREFQTVWNSQAMVDFRRAHREGRIPPLCKTCYIAEL